MKIRTTKYMIKEGLINSYRNKLMSLASVSIVTATLVIFGVFFLLIANFNYNLKIVKSQPEMVAYCESDLNDASVAKVETSIASNTKIDGYTKVTKEENFKKLQDMFADDKDLLEGMDASQMSVSYIIKVKDLKQSKEVKDDITKINGIRKVDYSQDIINFLTKISYWMKVISAVLIVILLVVCMFIIANTIRLTVFARKREINIMKYIGATDWFIRWPFIVEGVIISMIGAIVAFIIVGYGYSILSNKFNSDISRVGTDVNNIINFLSMKEVAFRILGVYALVGVTVGILGSSISLRKYLHV